MVLGVNSIHTPVLVLASTSTIPHPPTHKRNEPDEAID